MFDKDTLTALQESVSIHQANNAVAVSKDTKEVIALPSDYQLHNLEKYLPNRRRARGKMATASVQAFAAYTQAHGEIGTAVFVDQSDMSATAVLNLGTLEAPGHADNCARLTLKKTAAYSALLAHANGTGLKQSTVAEFLEDWPEHIQCFNDSGAITPPKAIAAIRKLTIESMRKMESSDQQLSASRSAFESVQATSADPLPTTIYFACQPYADLPERTFVLRLGVLTGGDKPTVTLRIAKAEQHNEEMANQLAELIAGRFDVPTVQVLLGTYGKAD